MMTLGIIMILVRLVLLGLLEMRLGLLEILLGIMVQLFVMRYVFTYIYTSRGCKPRSITIHLCIQ